MQERTPFVSIVCDRAACHLGFVGFILTSLQPSIKLSCWEASTSAHQAFLDKEMTIILSVESEIRRTTNLQARVLIG